MTKKIHNNSMTGQKGINLIEKIVLEMGFVWYPTGGMEAGIDGTIEIRNPQTGESITIDVRRILSFKPSSILKLTCK